MGVTPAGYADIPCGTRCGGVVPQIGYPGARGCVYSLAITDVPMSTSSHTFVTGRTIRLSRTRK